MLCAIPARNSATGLRPATRSWQRLEASLEILIFASDAFSGWLANQILRNQCGDFTVFRLDGINKCPNGWMHIANKMEKAIVPALALILCPRFIV